MKRTKTLIIRIFDAAFVIAVVATIGGLIDLAFFGAMVTAFVAILAYSLGRDLNDLWEL